MILEDFSQSFHFEGEIDSIQRQFVEEGMKCSLKLPYEREDIEGLKIEKVTASEEEKYRVSAPVDSAKVNKSGDAILNCQKESKMYDSCVPLSALYGSKDDFYILAVTETASIMGLHATAVKIPVKVIDQNEEYAAIEGSFYDYDQIILSSSKTVNDGGRIRTVDEL